MERTIRTYNGGKGGAGTYQTIINEIPPIDTFIEVFAGGAAVAHNLKPPGSIVINDIDAGVIDQYIYARYPAILTNMDYKTCIDKHAYACSKCLVYADPPYLFETRKSQRTLYNYEWDVQDHIAFLDYARSMKCLCIISHYPCKRYDETLAGWRTVDFKSMTRNGLADERLYCNYSQPQKLHDYRYLGEDFTDRQRIKRKIQRVKTKLAMLQPLERAAFIAAVIEENSYDGSQLL